MINLIAFYLLIGILAYFPIGRMAGMKFTGYPWHAILLAWTVWAIIWLPFLLVTLIKLLAVKPKGQK